MRSSRLEGRSASIDEVAARLPDPRPGGFSLKELRDAASGLGLPLVGISIGKEARAVDRPMLAFLKVDRKGHFVAIRPVGHTGRLVQVIDSNQPPRVMDKADLVESDQWTGVVLAPRRTNWPVVAVAGVLAGSGGLGIAMFRHWRGRKAVGPPASAVAG